MKIKTKFIGEIDINENEIIHLPAGMPAFENEKDFILMPFGEESPFIMFQSVNKQELCFVLAYPFFVLKDYHFDLSDEDSELLEVDKPEDVLCYCVVSVKDPFEHSTLNLKAPLVVNMKSKKGKQIVLHDKEYSIRYPIQSPQNKEE